MNSFGIISAGFGRSFLAGALSAILFAEVSSAEELPESRPALFGNGPESLVNKVDAQRLFARGQRDGWVMFNSVIFPDGIVSRVVLYRVSADMDLLKDEISKGLKFAHFVPAVYNHRRTYSSFAGTVVFVVANGHPHLRFFSNQDLDELKRGSDLIWPQAVYVPNAPPPKDPGQYPGHAELLEQEGLVKLRQSVDAKGNVTDVSIVSENPPGQHFGENAVKSIRGGHFLPAYRNGHPIAISRVFDYRFIPMF